MLNNPMNDNYFVRIYREMINEEGNYLLTNEELYVYALTFTNMRVDESVYTSIDMIDSIMQSGGNLEKFSKRVQTNKAKIKEAFVGMVDKGVLEVHEDIDINDIKNNTFFTVSVSDDIKDIGFDKLLFGELKMMTNAPELKVFTVAKRWTTYSGHFKGSFERWAKLLGVSRNTAQRMLNDAEYKEVTEIQEDGSKVIRQSGVVHVRRGKHMRKSKKQEINLYYYKDFMRDKKKQSITKKQTEQGQAVEPQAESKPITKIVKSPTLDSNDRQVAEPILTAKEKVGDSLPF